MPLEGHLSHLAGRNHFRGVDCGAAGSSCKLQFTPTSEIQPKAKRIGEETDALYHL